MIVSAALKHYSSSSSSHNKGRTPMESGAKPEQACGRCFKLAHARKTHTRHLAQDTAYHTAHMYSRPRTSLVRKQNPPLNFDMNMKRILLIYFVLYDRACDTLHRSYHAGLPCNSICMALLFYIIQDTCCSTSCNSI